MANLQGWECPRCGKIHSPYSLMCDCPPRTFTASAISGTPIFIDAKPLTEEFQKVLNETFKKSLKKKPTGKRI